MQFQEPYKPHCAPIVFLSLEGKAREAILKLDITILHADDGIEKLFVKLLFLEDVNQSAFMTYKFEQYQRENDMSTDEVNNAVMSQN